MTIKPAKDVHSDLSAEETRTFPSMTHALRWSERVVRKQLLVSRQSAPGSTKRGPRRGVPDLRSNSPPINSTILENHIQRQVGDPPGPLSLRADSTPGGDTLFEPSRLVFHEKLCAHGRTQLTLLPMVNLTKSAQAVESLEKIEITWQGIMNPILKESPTLVKIVANQAVLLILFPFIFQPITIKKFRF